MLQGGFCPDGSLADGGRILSRCSIRCRRRSRVHRTPRELATRQDQASRRGHHRVHGAARAWSRHQSGHALPPSHPDHGEAIATSSQFYVRWSSRLPARAREKKERGPRPRPRGMAFAYALFSFTLFFLVEEKAFLMGWVSSLCAV